MPLPDLILGMEGRVGLTIRLTLGPRKNSALKNAKVTLLISIAVLVLYQNLCIN